MGLESFPRELAERIRSGLEAGVSDEQMVEGIVSLGDVLAKFVQPDTPEEALMREMWQTSTEEEKKTLAGLIVRLGKKKVH
ncbi:MAG: DUF3243 family protein [Clostridia bacterium]|nr:DUF3243 family protein [Clostridia bacterium]